MSAPARFDYYRYRLNSVKADVERELDFMMSSPVFMEEPYAGYLEYIKKKLGVDKFDPKEIHVYDEKGNLSIMQKVDKEYIKQQSDDMYSRPWGKIRIYHKKLKIDQFVNNLKYSSKVSDKKIHKNRSEIIEKLYWGLSNKCFCKNKSVITYDAEEMVIKSISCLSYNKKTRLYEIEWD